VRTGQRVESGQVLLVLRNPELVLERDRAEAERRIGRLYMSRADAAGNQADVRQLRTRQEQLDQLLSAAESRLAQLAIVAPREAIVLTDRPHELEGRYVDQGDLLLHLAGPGEAKAALQLSEREADRLAVGSRAELRVRSYPSSTFQGRVAANAAAASAETPAVLTTRYDGEIPVRQTAAGWRTAQKVYRAELRIDDPGQLLRPGMSGRTCIHLGRRTVGGWLWHTLRDQLSINLLLEQPRSN
jgi:multidrug resistance efflux pump